MKTLYTSDTHFGHLNIIRYCNRPYCHFPYLHQRDTPCSNCDVHLMNKALTENWNAVVAPDDVVYHLGDFAMGRKSNIPVYRQYLNGKIILISGNHDRNAKQMKEAGFDEVHEQLELEVDGKRLLLVHAPPLHAQAAQYDYVLHGHVHNQFARRGNLINVGVDVRGYRPVSLVELLATSDELNRANCLL